MYFSCHSPDMLKDLYLLFDLLSIVTVAMEMIGIIWIKNVPVSLKMAGLSSVKCYCLVAENVIVIHNGNAHFSSGKPTW